jgi:hypothetical protein
MATIRIARGTDPFKKYWWVILVAFGGIGGWICLPAMNGASGGASAAPQEAGLQTAEQSLDSADNPAGAPGGAINLSMGGGKQKKTDNASVSSLFQAPEEKPAAAPGLEPAPKNMADALKDITRASAAKASVKAAASAGGWGEQAQRGFTAPKASFGGMSGLGSGSGSGASSNSSGGGFGGTAVGGFGGKNANTGVSFAKGLKDDGSGSAPTGSKGAVMKSLENSRGASVGAAMQSSNDASKGQSGSTFDGGGRGGAVAGGGAAVGASGGVYGKLDSAPANLKANDPNLNSQKIQAPPTPTPNVAADPNAAMKAMMMQMLMGVVMAGIMACIGI